MFAAIANALALGAATVISTQKIDPLPVAVHLQVRSTAYLKDDIPPYFLDVPWRTVAGQAEINEAAPADRAFTSVGILSCVGFDRAGGLVNCKSQGGVTNLNMEASLAALRLVKLYKTSPKFAKSVFGRIKKIDFYLMFFPEHAVLSENCMPFCTITPPPQPPPLATPSK